jgi:hypothetical protein
MTIIKGRSAVTKLVIAVVVSTGFIILALVGNSQKAAASASGPSPSHTNAPGESNCTACHSDNPLNTGSGRVTISGIPHDYRPGQQVTVSVTTALEDAVIFGFQMTAIDSLGRTVGAFTLPTVQPATMQIKEGNVDGNLRLYVEHTSNGLFTQGVFGSNTWTFRWTAPSQRVGKIGFYAAGNGANSDGGTSGDYIYTDATASLSGTAIANFDGDLQSDISVFRPSDGTWYSYSIASGDYTIYQWGTLGDRIAPGDYDGDGTTDFAVFRPSTGIWYLQQSTAGFRDVQFGTAGDLTAAGDYDGDGKTDIAVYRPSTGVWYILRSTGGFTATNFGINGDKPVQGDYDADGKTDIGVYRPGDGHWYLLQSSAGFTATQFGISEDRPVQADYDGDGKTDIAVFRPSTGAWYISKSRDGVLGLSFGVATDLTAPADYDGDGKTDIAVYRPSTGAWYAALSGDNSIYITVFGVDGDIPAPSGYLSE